MNLHPTQLETLVRARAEHYLHEAQQERLAKVATSGRARISFSSILRLPIFAAPRAPLASQASC